MKFHRYIICCIVSILLVGLWIDFSFSHFLEKSYGFSLTLFGVAFFILAPIILGIWWTQMP